MKIRKVKCHAEVKKCGISTFVDLRQRNKKIISLQCRNEFIHIGAGGKPVNVQLGMMSEKIAVGRNIYGIGVPVVKEIRHDFFQDADLITLRVKRQERSLF